MTIVDDQPESQPVCDPVEPTEGNLFVSAYPPFSCWKPEYVTDIDRMLGKLRARTMFRWDCMFISRFVLSDAISVITVLLLIRLQRRSIRIWML